MVGIHLFLNASRNWVRIDTIFILGFIIVNFQWPLMVILAGIFPEKIVFLRMLETHLTFGLWLSTIGITAWALGFSLNFSHIVRKVSYVKRVWPLPVWSFILLAAFIITVGPDYLSGQIYKEVRFGGYNTVSGVSGYILVLLSIVAIIFPGTMIYLNINSDRSKTTIQTPQIFETTKHSMYVFIGVYILLFTIAGERGNIVQLASALAIAICTTRYPLSFFKFMGGILVAALFFSYLGLARAEGWSAALSFFETLNLWQPTQNLADSSLTIYTGIEIIDGRGAFYYGQLWLSNLLAIIPFVQSAFISLTDFTNQELGSSLLITYYILGDSPTSGYGTSLVIDIYMNVGWIGVILFMAAYGVICKIMQTYITGAYGLQKFIMALIFCSLVFYIPRAGLFVQLRPIIWGGILTYILLNIRNVYVRK